MQTCRGCTRSTFSSSWWGLEWSSPFCGYSNVQYYGISSLEACNTTVQLDPPPRLEPVFTEMERWTNVQSPSPLVYYVRSSLCLQWATQVQSQYDILALSNNTSRHFCLTAHYGDHKVAPVWGYVSTWALPISIKLSGSLLLCTSDSYLYGERLKRFISTIAVTQLRRISPLPKHNICIYISLKKRSFLLKASLSVSCRCVSGHQIGSDNPLFTSHGV